MATNQVQEGDVITYTNGGAAIAGGDVVIVGSLIGVAAADIAASSGVGSVYIEGVFNLPKATGAAWTNGLRLVWDASTKTFDTVAHTSGGVTTGDVTVNAVAFGAAGTSDTKGHVLINVSPGTVN